MLLTVAIIALILSIPAVLMQFTDEVKWSMGDFVVAGVLLSFFAFAILSIRRKVGKRIHRRILYFTLIH